MKIAEDGRAIVCGEVVPAAEVKVLQVLVRLTEKSTATQILNILNLPYYFCSLPSLCIYLKRLQKRGLVDKGHLIVTASIQRITTRTAWGANDAVKEDFKIQS